jgi:hypothetical protein
MEVENRRSIEPGWNIIESQTLVIAGLEWI